MNREPLEVLNFGMVTPVGLTAPATAAAVRAGISRTRESAFLDGDSEPIRAAFIEDEHLPQLLVPPSALKEPVSRHARMLRLAAPALQQACRELPSPPTLLLALPQASHTEGADFLHHLAQQSNVELNRRESRLFFNGRAGGMLALEKAFSLLTRAGPELVLVGGVDSYLDPSLLDTLWEEERLLSHGAYDGFIPGEGAAFVLLGRRGSGQRLGITPVAHVLSVGLGVEKGHLYSHEPHLGEGLAGAFQELFKGLSFEYPRVRRVYAGLNGEGFWAKEWGVAYLRNSSRFEDGCRTEHPIEYLGDPGAALGAIMLSLAALGIHKGYSAAPCLLWCASDLEERGAALMDVAR